MAEIKMDISEYEAMQENKALLEKALKKEETLNAEIKKLQQEKVDALEAAKMKVVKVIRHETTQHIARRKPARQILEDLLRAFGMNHETIMRQIADVQYQRSLQRIDMNGYPDERFIDHILTNCFTMMDSHSEPTEEKTIVGLDDVKVELRKELEEELRKELAKAAKEREEANELIEDSKKLKKENKYFDKENKLLQKQLEDLVSEIEFNKELETNYASYKSALEQIQRIAEPTIWNFKKFVKEVKKIINNVFDKQTN